MGTIAGGTVRNAVPESTSFSGEFRSRNAKTLELMRNQVLDAVAAARLRYPEANIQEELESQIQMYSLAEDAQIVTRVTRAIAALGMISELGASGGGSDAYIFNLRGTQSVVVGIGTKDIHTTREHLDVGELVDAARFCYSLLMQQ